MFCIRTLPSVIHSHYINFYTIRIFNFDILPSTMFGWKGIVLSFIYSWLGFANEDLWSFSTLSSTAGTLVADHTDAGETGPRAVSAGKSSIWCGGGGVAGLPPLSLVFKCIRSISIKDRNPGSWFGLVTSLTWLVIVCCSVLFVHWT